MTIGYELDPREALLSAETLNGSVAQQENTVTISIMGEALLVGSSGTSRLTPLEIPIMNALGLGREHKLGRAALLESIAAPEYAPGVFARRQAWRHNQ